VLRACKGLDNDHRRAAVPADEGGLRGAVAGAVVTRLCGKVGCRLMQQFSRSGDVVLAVGIGEQPVVSDAMEA